MQNDKLVYKTISFRILFPSVASQITCQGNHFEQFECPAPACWFSFLIQIFQFNF